MKGTGTNSVWVNIERIVNLGNYENIKFSVGEERTVQEGQDPEEVRDEITDIAVEKIDELVNNKT